MTEKKKNTVISHFFSNSLNIISLNPFISDISARKQYFSGRFMKQVVAAIRFRTSVLKNTTKLHDKVWTRLFSNVLETKGMRYDERVKYKVILTEAYIRHHLLHKSARKLLEMSEINGLSEIILRYLEKKCDMTVIFTFSVNILSTNY